MERNIDFKEDTLICKLAEWYVHIGQSIEKEKQEIIDVMEFMLQNSAKWKIPIKIHIVGSIAGGVLGLDLYNVETDIDFMIVCSLYNAYERRVIRCNNDQCIFRMDSEGTVPGNVYLKLRTYDDATKTTYEERFSSTDILTSNSTLAANFEIPVQRVCRLIGAPLLSEGHVNGPSLHTKLLTHGDLTSNLPSCIKSFDAVFAIKCQEWPKIADEWFQRERPFNWPPGEIIANILETGCYLVPIGKNDEYEWRISFVLAEKLLFRYMNQMQKFVYLFLKTIREEIFSPITSGISSYILKTILFWVSEENDVANWQPSKVLQYVRLCLLKLTDFLCFGTCPHYFMKRCDLFYKKMSHVEIVRIIDKLTNLTSFTNFKEAILSLKSIRLLTKNSFLPYIHLPLMLSKCSDMISQIFRKLLSRCYNELSVEFVGTLFDKEDLKKPEQAMVIIANVLKKVKEWDGDLSMPFKDTLIRLLSCLQIRAKCAYEFQGMSAPNGSKTIEERFQIVSDLIKLSNLQAETMCTADLTQIAHAFFSLGCFENCLKIISPMLEILKTNIQTRVAEDSFRSANQMLMATMFEKSDIQTRVTEDSFRSANQMLMAIMFEKSDCLFASPLSPVADIVLFAFDEQMLTKDLKLEMIAFEMQTGSFWNAFSTFVTKQLPDFNKELEFTTNCLKFSLDPVVYAYYLKFQCCRFLGDNIGSCSVLREFKEIAFLEDFQDTKTFNLLGCCLKENGYIEEALSMFGQSIKKNKELLGTKFHIAILLRQAFNF